MDLEFGTIAEISSALRAGELTCADIVRRALARTERLGYLNSMVGVDVEGSMAAAILLDAEIRAGRWRGQLHGIPFVAKDNIDTVSLATSGCTPALLGNRPGRNAPVIERFLGAGAVLVGKTNMHELAFGVTNNNGAFGPARNPYNQSLIAGGSSGGTAVAVAARIVPFGLGTDTGGSVRVPAALCGLVGFRPTLGRYPSQGIIPISGTRDTVGVIAGTVADVANVDAVITGSGESVRLPQVRGLRIGIPRSFFYEDLEQAVEREMEKFLSTLHNAGVHLIDADIPNIRALNESVSFVVVNYEARRAMERYLAASAPQVSFTQVLDSVVSPDVRALYGAIAKNDLVTEEQYLRARDIDRPALQARLSGYLADHDLDAYVVPTVPMTARPIGDDETVELNGRRVPTFLSFIRNADPSSNAGIPSVSIPIGASNEGLPMGAMLEGATGRDRALLGIAQALASLVPPVARPSSCQV
jgi:mandelamide amidase